MKEPNAVVCVGEISNPHCPLEACVPTPAGSVRYLTVVFLGDSLGIAQGEVRLNAKAR